MNNFGWSYYSKFKPVWDIIDYLITGDENYILYMLKPYLDARNDPHNAFEHRIRNMWVPHHYSSELRRLVSRIMVNFFASGLDSNPVFLPKRDNIFAYCQSGLTYLLNYGGTCSIVTPPIDSSHGYSLCQIPGRDIIDVCRSSYDDSVTYINWATYERGYNPQLQVIEDQVRYHYYYIDSSGKVYYYNVLYSASVCTSGFYYQNPDAFSPSLGNKTSFTEIPVVGVNLDVNDRIIFRGTPYLFSLANSCMKSALAEAKLDYLIDFVLPPILTYSGNIGLNSLRNADWRGIQVGSQEKVGYLTYDGPVLGAGEDQLDRYRKDIESQLPVKSDGANHSATEAKILDENSSMIKIFLLDRYIDYCRRVVLLANQFSLVEGIKLQLFDIQHTDINYVTTNPLHNSTANSSAN